MIVHVVMYQFKNELSKMANMVKAKEMLEELPKKYEYVLTMQVGFDFNHGANSYDFCIYTTFQTKDHLMWFKAESETIEVVNFLKESTVEMHVVDYEVDDEE